MNWKTWLQFPWIAIIVLIIWLLLSIWLNPHIRGWVLISAQGIKSLVVHQSRRAIQTVDHHRRRLWNPVSRWGMMTRSIVNHHRKGLRELAWLLAAIVAAYVLSAWLDPHLNAWISWLRSPDYKAILTHAPILYFAGFAISASYFLALIARFLTQKNHGIRWNAVSIVALLLACCGPHLIAYFIGFRPYVLGSGTTLLVSVGVGLASGVVFASVTEFWDF